jgi:hypothetical protein
MRFRYFDFAEIFAKRQKVTPAQICMALMAIFIWLYPLTASAQARRINGYAVQVAALSSHRTADALAQGLSARGMSAYLVGGASYSARGSAALYRVRVGNFQTIATANSYAEKLVGAGLVEAYAITAYEPPSTGDSISGSSWKIQIFAQKRPQKYPGRQLGPGGMDLIDVVATIGSRGWLLLSSESINLTVKSGNSAISRELSALVDTIGSRGWGLNNNITKFLGSSAPVNIVSLPSDILTSGAITSGVGAPPAIATAGSLNAAGPEIGRGTLAPTSSTSMRGGPSSSRGYNPPARLQGSIEMRGGRMWVTLRNADTDRVFSGVARISLSEDQKQEDVTPINVTLLPDKETAFPLDEGTLMNGSWVLMVYDQNGAARLIRGASFAPPKMPSQAPGSSDSTEPGPAPEAPPSYVTGVYDTTNSNWTQPEVSPQAESQTAVTGAQDNTSFVEGAPAAPNPEPQAANDPGTVTATLRQIAVTSENVTLELDISAQNALKNITVTLRAGDFQDVRQAFIPTSQGRVPFLVPAKFAASGVYYEVKDEAQRLLSSGNASLRNLSK